MKIKFDIDSIFMMYNLIFNLQVILGYFLKQSRTPEHGGKGAAPLMSLKSREKKVKVPFLCCLKADLH